MGISFYTFQTMAYTIDIYRGDIREPERHFGRFALYVAFFPQLVAGPVERAPHLLPQFSRPFRLSIPMVKRGVFLILLGFIKKVVIADRLARAIEPYYDLNTLSGELTGAKAAAAQLLFTCQIYVDFSSYSDIAIGLGLLLGYHIRPNFNLPFVVPSIPERWRRWHISMSHWFRDYIFIPLGAAGRACADPGQHHGCDVLERALPGPANFVVWGLLNGATMVSHRLRRPLRWLRERAEAGLSTPYYYLCCWNTFCTIASINIFRCPDWETAKSYVRVIFAPGLDLYSESLRQWGELDWDLYSGMIWIGLVFSAHEVQRYLGARESFWSALGLSSRLPVMFWTVVTFGISGPQFIYYQF